MSKVSDYSLYFGFQGVLFGLIGAGAEVAAKQIDEQNKPLRVICETAAKVVQVAGLLMSLLALNGSLISNFALPIPLLVFSLAQITIKILQHTENDTLKNIAIVADRVLSKSINIINIAILPIPLSVPLLQELYLQFPRHFIDIIGATTVIGIGVLGIATAFYGNYKAFASDQ